MTAMATEASTLTDRQPVRIIDSGVSSRQYNGREGLYLADESEPGSQCCEGAHSLVVEIDGTTITVRSVEPVEAVTTPDAPAFFVGQRVRVADEAFSRPDGTGYVSSEYFGQEVVIQNLTGSDGDGRNFLVRGEGPRLGTHYIASRYLTPVETAPERQPGEFRVGDRVRSGLHGTGTIVEPPAGSETPPGQYIPFGLRLDSTNNGGGYFGGGVYAVRAADLTLIEPEVTPPRPRVFAVGDRIVIATPEVIATREHLSGSSGSFQRGYEGQTGVIISGGGTSAEGNIWSLRLDSGETGNVWQSHIDHADAGTTESPRRSGEFVTGDTVRLNAPASAHHGQTGTVYGRTAANRVRVRFSDGLGFAYEPVRLELVTAAPATAASTPPPAPAPVVENPMALGTVVIVGSYRGTVVDKADPWFRDNYGPSYQRNPRFVGYEYTDERGRTQKAMCGVQECVEYIDPGDLTVEQQLARLQVLIHRVASYEAVRRSWCSEVNAALAPLGLPEHLSTVDRDLGNALQRNPRELLRLDGEIQSARTPVATPTTPVHPDDYDTDGDDDEDTSGSASYRLNIDVDSYESEIGFTVSGCTVSVDIDVEWDNEDENPGDPDSFSWSDYVNDDMVLQAIRDDGDLPTPGRYASVSWSESGNWD